MEDIFAWVLVIGIVGGIILFQILMQKGVNAVAKAANKNILYRSEYEEGQRLVSAPIIFKTSLSISDIMRELMMHVTTVETPLGFKAGVYQVSRDERNIVYAFGNKLVPQTFVASISFSNNGTVTEGTFEILKWKENAGMIVGQENINKFRKEVEKAFTAIEKSDSSNNKSNGIYCGACGIGNSASAKFCKNCGKQIA